MSLQRPEFWVEPRRGDARFFRSSEPGTGYLGNCGTGVKGAKGNYAPPNPQQGNSAVRIRSVFLPKHPASFGVSQNPSSSSFVLQIHDEKCSGYTCLIRSGSMFCIWGAGTAALLPTSHNTHPRPQDSGVLRGSETSGSGDFPPAPFSLWVCSAFSRMGSGMPRPLEAPANGEREKQSALVFELGLQSREEARATRRQYTLPAPPVEYHGKKTQFEPNCQVEEEQLQ